MNILNNLVDIFIECELYENSKKGKNDRKLLNEFLEKHGTPIIINEEDR
jgi:hypothetical protein